MKRVLLILLFAAALPAADKETPPVNVNAKYKVSSVDLKPARHYYLSASLRSEVKRLVGQNFSQETVDRLARRLRDELKAHAVRPKVSKGAEPETVSVVFEIERWVRSTSVSASNPLYHSKEGWSGAIDVAQNFGATRLGAGLISDGDQLVERYAGVRAKFERLSLFTDRAGLTFEFGSFHQQWSRSTLAALEERPDVPGIYRTRQSFQPTLTIQLTPSVSVGAGASFQRFQTQFPAAHTQAANAATLTLRFHERWERPDSTHSLDAGYSLSAATRTLESDLVYNSHWWDARYSYSTGRQRVLVKVGAGKINGRAPLFARYVAGNSEVLRGWNRWDLAPLGGDRLAYGSLEYQYDLFGVFYDTGSVWDRGDSPTARHSLGLALHIDHHGWKPAREGGYRKGFLLAVAFPLKDGRADPVFLMGMSF